MASEYTLEMIMMLSLDRADLLRADPVTGNPAAVDSVHMNAVASHVNAELAALWDALIGTYEDYCIKHLQVEVKAGVENYSLPSDFYKFRKVFPIQSGRRCVALRKFDLRDLGEADSLSAIFTSRIEETRYKVNGNRLWLHPIPTNAAELEMWYVPQFDPIVNFDDRIDFRFPFGWEQYVTEGVAARMLEKEESDASAQRTRQKEVLQRILIMAEDRDVGEPFQMIDAEDQT